MSLSPPEPSRPLPARPASPCVNVCRMHAASGLCEGCGRTIAEIASWGSWGPAERERVWAQLAARREDLARRLASEAKRP